LRCWSAYSRSGSGSVGGADSVQVADLADPATRPPGAARDRLPPARGGLRRCRRRSSSRGAHQPDGGDPLDDALHVLREPPRAPGGVEPPHGCASAPSLEDVGARGRVTPSLRAHRGAVESHTRWPGDLPLGMAGSYPRHPWKARTRETDRGRRRLGLSRRRGRRSSGTRLLVVCRRRCSKVGPSAIGQEPAKSRAPCRSAARRISCSARRPWSLLSRTCDCRRSERRSTSMSVIVGQCSSRGPAVKL
jgi:hypothetical protein